MRRGKAEGGRAAMLHCDLRHSAAERSRGARLGSEQVRAPSQISI